MLPSLFPSALLRALARVAAAAIVSVAGPAMACGVHEDCVVGDRTYRIHLPPGAEDGARVGAIVYAHGYRGSAAAVMRHKTLAQVADALGVALIAADAEGDDWAIPGVPNDAKATGDAELRYFDQVVADAAARFPIDPDRLMATGFSAGGMMIWNLACHRSGLFAAFAPIAGTFWAPIPETCEGPPAHLIHYHGAEDRVVPLSGRPIGDSHQGDVFKALEMYAAFGGYSDAAFEKSGRYDCARRTNPEGALLMFCAYPGGHTLRAETLRDAWRAFEAVGAL